MSSVRLMEAVKPLLIKHEGRSMSVYYDTMNIPTIGVGFNLLRPDARQLCQQCGADYDALLAGTAELTGIQSDYILDQCIIEVIDWMVKVVPEFSSFTLNRQSALIDMGFNLGETRFREFAFMIAALNGEHWHDAAQEMLNSLWAKQVGPRATELARMLVEG